MPSSLATLLTILFIVWAFRWTSRGDPAFLRGLWIPTIWVGIFASRMVGNWFGGETSSLDGSPLDRNIFLVLIFLGVRQLVRRRLNWDVLKRNNRAFVLFIAFCALSSVWADFPFVAFKRWIKEVGTVVMVLLIATEPNPIQSVRKVFLRCAYVLVPLSILFIKYYVEIGRTYDEWTGEAMFCGVATEKNALGRLCFVSTLFLLSSLLETKQEGGWFTRLKRGLPQTLVLGMCAWLLLKADSSTAKGCVAIGIMAFFLARWDFLRRSPKLAGVGSVALIIVSFLILVEPSVRKVIAEALGRRGDLTDRAYIWEGSFALETNPLIGCGYGSVWLTQRGRQLQLKLKMAHSHNGFLETYLNTGLIGLSLLLAIVAAAGGNAVRRVISGEEGGALLAALFFSCTIYNYTEVGFSNISIVGFLMWFLAVRAGGGLRPGPGGSRVGVTPDGTTALPG